MSDERTSPRLADVSGPTNAKPSSPQAKQGGLPDGLIEIDGTPYYAIADVDTLDPFLMHVVSDGDRWMFLSSTGGLTAGRGDADAALFPYETDDRLHRSIGHAGPITSIRVGDNHWRPFTGDTTATSGRSLAKSVVGDCVVFEEHNPDLGLAFRYRWNSTELHGFIRTATLTNTSGEPRAIELVDGLVGLLPHGLEPQTYQRLSNLSNAYKRSELVDDSSGLALYSLEAPVSDSAEPRQILRTTVAWSLGLDGATVSLDPATVDRFDARDALDPASLLTGRAGGYLLHHGFTLDAGEQITWRIVADVARDHVDVEALRDELCDPVKLGKAVNAGIRETFDALASIMAGADAWQHTNDGVACAHHVANVTYNVMRGGIPVGGYRVDREDFVRFLHERNRAVEHRHAGWLRELPAILDRRHLLDRISEQGDDDLLRLGSEYLPFSFSRRHGDPSRPWNIFSIRLRDDDDEPSLYYEGNWRDVFQNWEALCQSFPQYLPGVIALFLNASTADGHNPYRITRAGIDWEVPDPDDPWANIGYWGDHQLIYLLRLLEATDRFMPGEIERMMQQRLFTYADVPYRIAPFADLVRDPKSTISFDEEANTVALARFEEIGADGKLLARENGELVTATMLEKVLVTVLAKLANFVPGGGIWMNTQRPEWNDANNALVGYGLSVVTLQHLRRFLRYLSTLSARLIDAGDIPVASEVMDWLETTMVALQSMPVESAAQQDDTRRQMLDQLGNAASVYRSGLYADGFGSASAPVAASTIVDFCEQALSHIDATLVGSRRSDGLVHAYNLVDFGADDDVARVQHLPPMLEGQVAALQSGLLDAGEQADLVDALFASPLYRADQNTFMLAPVIKLPGFLDKNLIPDQLVEQNDLLTELIGAGDTSLVRRDARGRIRFHPDLVDDAAVRDTLNRLAQHKRWSGLVEQHRVDTLEAFEAVFSHRSFLGRSTAMYAYEGIGSIYWHMVGKLLVGVQEAAIEAVESSAPAVVVDRLVTAYERVRSGLGFNKTAVEFGAIPIDPYSHTPAHAGAQQPGMTGAVKEEILVRPVELGVRVSDGELTFDPLLFRASERLEHPAVWRPLTDGDQTINISLDAGTLGLTVCQMPIVIAAPGGEASIEIEFTDGRTERVPGLRLGPELSAEVFGRTGAIRLIRAALP